MPKPMPPAARTSHCACAAVLGGGTLEAEAGAVATEVARMRAARAALAAASSEAEAALAATSAGGTLAAGAGATVTQSHRLLPQLIY